MLDGAEDLKPPPPENELPARASARLGAKARAAQKNSDSQMRHRLPRTAMFEFNDIAVLIHAP
jgi:hypothetical protein